MQGKPGVNTDVPAATKQIHSRVVPGRSPPEVPVFTVVFGSISTAIGMNYSRGSWGNGHRRGCVGNPVLAGKESGKKVSRRGTL